MKAVNLIPADARPGGGAGAGGRSGGAAYALLGGLTVLVGLVALWTLTGRGLGDKRVELDRLHAQTAAIQAQQRAVPDSAPTDAAAARARVDTVRALATSRFDWAQTLDAVSRTMPDDAWLTSMTGTVAPGVSAAGSGGATGGLRSALAVPAIEIVGCTKSQSKVARLMARLQAVPGVDRVTLSDAAKGSAGGGAGTGDCRGTRADYPQFQMVLFFAPQAGAVQPAAAVAAPGTAAPTPAPVPAPAPAPTEEAK